MPVTTRPAAAAQPRSHTKADAFPPPNKVKDASGVTGLAASTPIVKESRELLKTAKKSNFTQVVLAAAAELNQRHPSSSPTDAALLNNVRGLASALYSLPSAKALLAPKARTGNELFEAAFRLASQAIAQTAVSGPTP